MVGEKKFPFGAKHLIKIRRGNEINTLKEQFRSRADNVFFRMGDDTYIASGSGLRIDRVKLGDPVDFDGRRGTVVARFNPSNSARESLSEVLIPAGLLGGLSTSAVAAVYLLYRWVRLERSALTVLKAAGKQSALYGIASGIIVAGALLAGAAIKGHRERSRVDFKLLEDLATERPPPVESPGYERDGPSPSKWPS